MQDAEEDFGDVGTGGCSDSAIEQNFRPKIPTGKWIGTQAWFPRAL